MKNRKKKGSEARISKPLSSTSVNDAVSTSCGANEGGANHMKHRVHHSAQTVGDAFVEQYYCVLSACPGLVHRFYGAKSVLSRPRSDGVMTSVTTMQGINEMILSFNHHDSSAEILTADAQESYNDGVILCVNGCLNGNNNVRRKFTQTFFLAPQEDGYFVLNDVFRYVDDMGSDDLDVGLPTKHSTHTLDSIGVPRESALDHITSVKVERKDNSEVNALEDGRKESVTEKGLVAENHVDQQVPEAAISNLPKHASKKTSLPVPTERKSDCTSHPFECELRDNKRNYAKVLASSKYTPSESIQESLFKFSKSLGDESRTMNWNNFVKQLKSLFYPEPREKRAHNAEWDSMNIFKERNKKMENEITIDLHGQHVKQAIRILKMHLLFGAYIQTVKILKLITGWGKHSQGNKGKIKSSVIQLLQKESIEWELDNGNPGTIVLKLGEQTEFSFLDAEEVP